MSIYELPKFGQPQKEPNKDLQPKIPETQPIEEGVPTIDINQQSYPFPVKTAARTGGAKEEAVMPGSVTGEPIAGQPAAGETGKRSASSLIGLALALAIFSGLAGGAFSGYYFYSKIKHEMGLNSGLGQTTVIQQQGTSTSTTVFQDSRETKIINTVKENSPSVVSITVSKNMPVYQYTDPFQYFFNDPFGGSPVVPQIQGYEMQPIGEGSGFIVSEDGLILTNKHVVDQAGAQYTVVTSDKKEYTAKILATDPVQDIAILKVDGTGFRPVNLGNSSDLQIGQTVIAIGNALGEFPNTVSTGVVSGLARSITASSGSQSQTSEKLDNVIQTDAAINAGNSGGPLLNISGEVIGMNTAIAVQGQGIGFALPIDLAKRDIDQVKKDGKISYPFLGIQYTLVNSEIAKKNGLSVDYGALITKNSGSASSAVVAGSPASKAGLKEGDVVLDFNGEKITEDNTLSKIISKYLPGDNVALKVLRAGKEISVGVTLGEYAQSK